MLRGLSREVKTPARVLICYDRPDDDTLPAVRANPDAHPALPVEFVRNPSRGAHAAIMAGFAASTAPLVVVYPADDDFNPGILDKMVEQARQGCDVVCASRFMPGGAMQGCPWLKATLVRTAAFTLHHSRDCHARSDQRLPDVFAPGDRAHPGRVRSGVLPTASSSW